MFTLFVHEIEIVATFLNASLIVTGKLFVNI